MSSLRPVLLLVAALTLVSAAHADCLDDAAAFHRVSPTLARGIAQVESGMRAGATNRNTNGTEDIGLMQINSVHLPRLAKFGITRQSLFDPCINAYVGTWILADCLSRYGETWTAVGCYNAGAPDKRLRYATRVYEMLRK
ncbi:lytic transglycosylase domain-containing protein (plasmid) [Cupriavidus pauculus]|uniref:Lytic transglycosylase domain-containing protein n=1 Tax=Cupriavidus pauculus TaxID=82633 RepID=A0A5P2H8N7_9BURK|nr:lytic transglycosylase domain-containing protein [Cupriavidus pauculus]QET04068.1 lytic transglycosylase domain-containing protein [Cupriavidus pauculus]